MPSKFSSDQHEDPGREQEPSGGTWGKRQFPSHQDRSRPRGKRQRERQIAAERGQRASKPEEVSPRVWDMAQTWLDTANGAFAPKRIPVNKQEFARRLGEKINSDQRLVSWMRKPVEYWDRFDGWWPDGHHFVNEVMYRAIQNFFEHLTEAQGPTSALQWAFLDEEWDYWIDYAIEGAQLSWLTTQEHLWVKPETKGTIDFNQKPDLDEPADDPDYPGMTWREIREADRAEFETFGKVTPEMDEAAEQEREERHQRAWERMTTALGDRLAKRHHKKTKETTADD